MHRMLGTAALRGREHVLGLGLGLSTIYALTLCPTVHWYDSAEFAASAATMRVMPHPPGYPLYSMIGHVFTWLPLEAALGMNIMSAAFSVAAALLLWACARKLGVSQASATVVAATFGTSHSVWENAVKTEVYGPGLVFTLATVWLCLHAAQTRKLWPAWVAAGVAGLGLGVHLSIATAGVCFGLLVGSLGLEWEGVRPRLALRRGLAALLGCVVALAIGGSILMLVPLGLFDEVAPLGIGPQPKELMWSRGIQYLQGGIFRGYFHNFPTLPRIWVIARIYGMNLTWLGVGLGLAGIWLGRNRHRLAVVALTGGFIGNIVWFFRYDVPDLDVFLLPGLSLYLLLIAIALDELGHVVAARWPGQEKWVPIIAGAMPLWLLVVEYRVVDLSEDRTAEAYGMEACAALEPRAIMAMTSQPKEWRHYTVMLYLHETGRACRDVEFWGSARPKWIAKAIRQNRPVYAFIDTPRFAPYFDLEPTGPLFRLRRLGSLSQPNVSPQ